MTHSNHLGTHLDGEIRFFTAGKDIAQLELNDFLVGPGVVVDLSDATGDYQICTPQMIEERVKVREGDILIIHTGYHHFGWDQPYADEIRYMVQHPGPDREFAEWAKEKKIKWIGVDCGSADHPMNTIIRDWMPRQAAEADRVFQEMYGDGDCSLREAIQAANTDAAVSGTMYMAALNDGPSGAELRTQVTGCHGIQQVPHLPVTRPFSVSQPLSPHVRVSTIIHHVAILRIAAPPILFDGFKKVW